MPLQKRVYRGSGALLTTVAIGFCPASAIAQEAANAEDSVSVLETVTVQARKRDESIEDVPASVTAISGDIAEQLVLDDVEDYVRQIPGGVLVASGPDYLNDIALRGQGGGRIGFSESTTGIYRDGMFVAGGGFGGRSFSRIDFFDMNTVEVYRGPQGALYGRNAVGGAVNIRSNKPTDDLYYRAKAGFGSADRYEVEGVFNAPLGDTGAALRVGGYYLDQQDGFYEDSATGEAIDSEEQWGMRGAVAMLISPNTHLTLTAEHSDSDAPGFASLGQNLNLDPDPFTRIGLSTTDRVKIEQTSLIAELSHDFDTSELTILANYKERDGDRPGGDLDHFLGFNSAALDLLDEQAEAFDRFGIEARLASSGDGPLTWLVGADYQTFTSKITSDRTGTILGPFAASAALRALLRNDASTEELESYSVFGLIGFDLTDRIDITFEARVQSDMKDFVFERVDGDPLTDGTIPRTEFDSDSTRFLPTLTLSYAVDDDTNLYGRIATGYRPGGFNPNPTEGFFDQTAYDPEDIVSGEVGLKGAYHFGDVVLRPQIAVYYSVTDDVQATTNLSTTNTAFSLQNVGGSEVYGAEFELSAYMPFGAGSLLTTAGLSTTQGEFDEGTDILFQGAEVSLSGLRVPRTRDYIVNLNTVYSQDLTDGLEGFLSFGFQAEGGGYDNAINARSSEGYEMFDLSVGVRGENWRLMAFGKNLSDDIYRLVEVNNNKFVNAPQRFGVSLVFEY